MASVLQELFIDIVQRGMEQATAAVDNLRRQMDEGTKSARQYREAVGQRVTNVDPTGDASGRRADVRSGMAAGRSIGTPGGGMDAAAGGVAKLGASAAMAALPMAAVGAGLAAISRGLQGTVELQRFTDGIARASRELANFVGPPLRFLGDTILEAVNAFRSLGPAGQELAAMFSGIALLTQIFQDPEMMSALNEMKAAFGELLTASRPLINLFATTAMMAIKDGLIKPLVSFTQILTTAAQALSLLSVAASQALTAFGLGSLMSERTGNRAELRLNQTGTEDAQGTFARIQEAVLRSGQGGEDNETKQTNYLQQISVGIDVLNAVIKEWLNKPAEVAGAIASSPPAKFAQGAADVGVFGLGGMLVSQIAKRL